MSRHPESGGRMLCRPRGLVLMCWVSRMVVMSVAFFSSVALLVTGWVVAAGNKVVVGVVKVAVGWTVD